MAVASGTTPNLQVSSGLGRVALSLAGLVLCLASGLAPFPAQASLVINEFLPDPAGSDGGREFVELFNTGTVSVSLDQVALQFANGAVAADWVTRWRGVGLGTVPPGGRFLIVDRNWLGLIPGDAEAYLGLQNGPDAIRLVRDTTVLDLVGYGSLTDPELFEEQPVPVVTGLSLSRRPDGRDSGNNRADFVAAEPTPSGPNFLPFSLALTDQVFDPSHLSRPGDPLHVSLVLRNNGTEDLTAGPCRLVWPTGATGAWWDGAAPDGVLTLHFVLRPELRGMVPLTFELAVGDRPDTLRCAVGPVQVGAPALRLHEVMPAPGQGQGEWIELHWTGSGSLDLTGYALRDEEGDWARLPAVTVPAGELAVAAEDSAALMAWWSANRLAGAPVCGTTAFAPMVLALSRWPSLNNTPPSSRAHADRVYLADPDGVVLDTVAWGGEHQELPDRDLSLERIGPEAVNPGAANWMVCTAQAGSTPGCVNSVTPGPAGAVAGSGLRVVPPVLDRITGPTAVHLKFTLVGAETSWEVRLFNLWGDGVRDFGGDARGPGPRDLVWDGHTDSGWQVGPGAYLVWLETRSASGLVQRREKFRMVVR